MLKVYLSVIHASLTLTDMCRYHAQLLTVTSDIDMISVVFIRDKSLKLCASMSIHTTGISLEKSRCLDAPPPMLPGVRATDCVALDYQTWQQFRKNDDSLIHVCHSSLRAISNGNFSRLCYKQNSPLPKQWLIEKIIGKTAKGCKRCERSRTGQSRRENW